MKKAALSTFFILVGFALGFLASNYFNDKSSSKKRNADRVVHRGFISPLLDCRDGDNLPLKRGMLYDNIKKYINKNSLNSSVSVFFSSLNEGSFLNYNSNENYILASLLKVPYMVGYLRYAQDNKSILDLNFTFQQDKLPRSISQNILPFSSLKDGEQYSFIDLIYRMVAYSDNEAMFLLDKHLPELDIESLLSEMGVRIKISDEAYLTTREYASLFRILYNSTYLNREKSNLALDIMSRSDMNLGIKKYIPKHIKVSHKFGERISGSITYFHDCGIVYHPKRPYLVCIMTKGQADINELAEHVAKLSGIIFDSVVKSSSR